MDQRANASVVEILATAPSRPVRARSALFVPGAVAELTPEAHVIAGRELYLPTDPRHGLLHRAQR